MRDLNTTITTWIEALNAYTYAQLCTQLAAGSWSLGQVAMHLIADTNFYLEQVRICLTTNDHALEEASAAAKTMFRQDAFPDEKIVGAPGHAYMSQPDSIEQLLQAFGHIKQEMQALQVLIDQSTFQGKTRHPGLGYFSAADWLQFADMHFRHHIRQQNRIAQFLALPEP